jgi:hypothetical protein
LAGTAVTTASRLTFRGLQVVTPAAYRKAMAHTGEGHEVSGRYHEGLWAQETEVDRLVRP